jgi:hypothetical protein
MTPPFFWLGREAEPAAIKHMLTAKREPVELAIGKKSKRRK